MGDSVGGRNIRVSLAGAGSVGVGVLNLLSERSSELGALGVHLSVNSVFVRNPARSRPEQRAEAQFTSAAPTPDDADVLIEVMGGTTDAGSLTRDFLEAGRPVITANKALLAERWSEFEPYLRRGLVYAEAAVMAGTPVLGPLSTTLRSSRLSGLHAVLSGTCNFILSEMETGQPYSAALAEAQRLGYAEDPPDLDVNGTDAAHKLSILARLSVDPGMPFERVERRGIAGLPDGLPRQALAGGRRIKLVGSLVGSGQGWRATVRPVFVPIGHLLAALDAGRNGLILDGSPCGPVSFTGGGAGGDVTASAVVGDLMAWLGGHPGHTPRPSAAPTPDADTTVLEEVPAWD